MDRAAQRSRDLAWLATAQVGDEVAVTNTFLTAHNPYSHIVNNFSGTNTRLAYGNNQEVLGAIREFCTITKIRAIIPDGWVVDNNVYGSDGMQQTEKPIESESIIEDGWELEKDTSFQCNDCGHPYKNRFIQKDVQYGELCEPTDYLKKLAAKLKFNEEVKNLNFRNFSDAKVLELITAINREFHDQVNAGASISTLWSS